MLIIMIFFWCAEMFLVMRFLFLTGCPARVNLSKSKLNFANI